MVLICTKHDGTQVGDSFNGTITPMRARDASSEHERRHRPHTHILLCPATAPVAAGLLVVTPDDRGYSVSKPYDAVTSPHQRQWLLLTQEAA